jgi:sugar lactone lactonase YvrE
MSQYQLFSKGPYKVGESPIWDGLARCLWWVDIESQCIHRAGLDESHNSWTLPEKVGCIALASDGRIIAAMETQIAALNLQHDGQFEMTCLAQVKHPAMGMRFNDGRCDPSGRFWVGTMVMDMGKASNLGALYCLDERGLTGPYLAGLYTPNGMAFSADGQKMYLSDSHPLAQKVWTFEFDIQSGELKHRQLFVDMNDMPGRPDGAAQDSHGSYWVCANDGGMVYCFNAAGELIQFLPVPFPKPAMCAFGGENLDQLFVTSIVPADMSLDTHGLSGSVVILEPGVRGLPEPLFSRFPVVPLP